MAAGNQITVPDIGDFKDVPIIEIHVKPGDTLKADDPLVTLESDKATMDVPAPGDGTVEEILVKLGDKVSEGSPIVRLKPDGAAGAEAPVVPPPQVIAQQEPSPPPRSKPAAPAAAPPQPTAEVISVAGVHAGPAVRRLARELGVDLGKLKGTGEKGRITKEDVR
ncbi:MAG: E3 binding domain-containing protein, partial [Acetobacteraceae bacterium]|nr:E3 binding domain-containing protein [Acetobacteraceae bacterium]